MSTKSSDQIFMIPYLFQQIDRSFTYDLLYADVEMSADEFREFIKDYRPVAKSFSSSESDIYRGIYNGRLSWLKSFELCTLAILNSAAKDIVCSLSYEKEVYRFIRYKSETDPELKKYFIDLLVCIKTPTHMNILSQDAQGIQLKEFVKRSTPLTLARYAPKFICITAPP